MIGLNSSLRHQRLRSAPSLLAYPLCLSGLQTKPPRNPRRPRNPKLDAPIRRSGRIADLPEQPVYPTPKARRSNLRAVPAYAISKAQELKGHPTFVIPMSRDSAPKNNRLVWKF